MAVQRRKVYMLALAVSLFGLAAAIYVRGAVFFGDEAAPNTAESQTWWYCYDCAKGFGLTAAEYDGRTIDARHPAAELKPGDIPLTVRVAPCAKCRKWAVAALTCPVDAAIFDRRPPDRSPPRCPLCGWSPGGPR